MNGSMGVVSSACGCCGEFKFVENRDAAEAREQTGEELICDACMDLPEEVAVGMMEMWHVAALSQEVTAAAARGVVMKVIGNLRK